MRSKGSQAVLEKGYAEAHDLHIGDIITRLLIGKINRITPAAVLKNRE